MQLLFIYLFTFLQFRLLVKKNIDQSVEGITEKMKSCLY